jgi:hypothetical protein
MPISATPPSICISIFSRASRRSTPKFLARSASSPFPQAANRSALTLVSSCALRSRSMPASRSSRAPAPANPTQPLRPPGHIATPKTICGWRCEPSLRPLVTVTALGGFWVATGFVARGEVLALGGFCVATASLFHFASADAGGPFNFKGRSWQSQVAFTCWRHSVPPNAHSTHGSRAELRHQRPAPACGHRRRRMVVPLGRIHDPRNDRGTAAWEVSGARSRRIPARAMAAEAHVLADGGALIARCLPIPQLRERRPPREFRRPVQAIAPPSRNSRDNAVG